MKRKLLEFRTDQAISLFKRIEESAKKNDRRVSAEMRHLLKKGLNNQNK